MAFHSAQPRPRAQVARSTGSRDWNMRRLSPDRNVQAMTVSQAGSPTAEQPKSITALSLDSRSGNPVEVGAPSNGLADTTCANVSRPRQARKLTIAAVHPERQ